MGPPPYEQAGANVAFWGLVGLFALGEYAMQFRSLWNRIRRRSGRLMERWSLALVLLGVVGGLIGGLTIATHRAGRISAGAGPLFVLGLIVMASGLLLRQWAVLVLGRSFTPEVRVRSGQEIVERGPYRWVRHPSYTGLLVFFAGLGLALSNWISLAVLVVTPLAGLLLRLRSEERALLAVMGEPYKRYAASHKRLLPGVW